MLSISKNIDLQKKRIKTLRRINLLTLSLLTYLVGSNTNNLLPTKARLAKKIKTTKKIFSIIRDKNRVILMNFLQQVSILSRKKRRISLISNTSTVKKRVITLISVLRTQKRSYKNCVSLGNLYASNCS